MSQKIQAFVEAFNIMQTFSNINATGDATHWCAFSQVQIQFHDHNKPSRTYS